MEMLTKYHIQNKNGFNDVCGNLKSDTRKPKSSTKSQINHWNLQICGSERWINGEYYNKHVQDAFPSRILRDYYAVGEFATGFWLHGRFFCFLPFLFMPRDTIIFIQIYYSSILCMCASCFVGLLWYPK